MQMAAAVGDDVLLKLIGLRVANVRGHAAVLRTADVDADRKAWCGFLIGQWIYDVYHVPPVDVNAGRRSELFPLVEELPVLVEDLD